MMSMGDLREAIKDIPDDFPVYFVDEDNNVTYPKMGKKVLEFFDFESKMMKKLTSFVIESPFLRSPSRREYQFTNREHDD